MASRHGSDCWHGTPRHPLLGFLTRRLPPGSCPTAPWALPASAAIRMNRHSCLIRRHAASATPRPRRWPAGRPGRWRRWWGVHGRPEGRRSRPPELGHGADAAGVIDQRRAVFDDGVHHRPPTHGELDRHPGDRSASSPAWQHASAPARRVSTAWPATWSECSAQVLASQSASTHATGA